MHIEQIAFLEILLFIVAALLFIGIGSIVGAWLRPHQPNAEKLSTYECGEAPTGSARGLFKTRFYIIGLVFLIFELETALLFLWAVVWNNQELHQATDGVWSCYAAFVGTSFIGVLVVGLVYVGAKGYLSWAQPSPTLPSFLSKVPQKYYDKINSQYGSWR